MKRSMLAAVTGVAALVSLAAAPVAAGSPSSAAWTRIASGLHNPRGLSVAPDGSLYAALAGVGDGTNGENYGPTAEVIRIKHPRKANPATTSVATGLPSFGSHEGTSTVGVDGISVDEQGRVFVIGAGSQMGLGAPVPEIGALLKIKPSGDHSILADVGDRNYKWSQHHPQFGTEFPDADPYGVLATGNVRYVADAGTNVVNRVLANGKTQVIAWIPFGQYADSTPTCVAMGPDGALYVGTLSFADSLFIGPPHPAANIWRIDLSQVKPGDVDTISTVATKWASGFFPINGCTFDRWGNLWVSEIFTGVDGQGNPTGGAVVKVPFNAHNPSNRTTYGEGFLQGAGGVAVDWWGHVYVANKTISASGSIWRLDP